ncbi:TetR/AcrR family transcriptional regulator [Cellulomonas fengjieae]|uniref:TetR family transcriptional regulator n=1 Tax=Cellulomonas fengjieae TaxID=2819978 RepID=A0ABS3SJ39_9CELL|nr:TetR/AcrR family transcriptional regulator [Cellulomonas fengjieae]MBO3085339.1 TetR family transcriptional regulator [Cellulomonas fengjieae]MBO3101085.1 TetR family transcriptional regulator [Cellulomonas fengjieae]QVI66107.1 TetR family transcriptional regulator [Cellulomonas fengjieae]
MSTDRLSALADAGLQLIAREGLRGLTHRAVDAEAGVPLGSTSYYFRTRDALVAACVRRLVELDLAELAAAGVAERRMTPEVLADLGADLMWHWITVDAHRQLARYELLLHARRRPELAAELHAAGDRLRDAMTTVLATQDCADPATTALWFAGCIDGVVLDQLTGPAERRMSRADLRVVAMALVRAALP